MLSTGKPCGVILTGSKGVYWVKDSAQVVVVDESSGKIFLLRGKEAALWSWLSLSYPYPKLAAMMSVLLGVSNAEAEQELETILQAWLSVGLLVRTESAHG